MVEVQVSQRLVTPLRNHRARVRCAAALGAGLVAGTALLVAMLVTAVAIYDESPWRVIRMIAATVYGEAALDGDGFDARIVAVGLAMHYALSMLYSLALAGLLVDFRRWLAPWMGLAFGIALYFANLYGFSHLFAWFVELRTADTLVAHALFGLLLARAYCELSSR